MSALPPSPLAAGNDQLRLRRAFFSGFGRDLIVSGVLPWLVVWFLQRRGVALLPALFAATAVPCIDLLVRWLRERRLGPVALINVGFLLVSIVLALWSGDAHVLLFKGALGTAAFALICLGSLAAPKPLMFFIAREMSTEGDPVARAAFAGRWADRGFRRGMRLITAGWGVGYLVEAVARVVIAYTLPPLTVLAVSPLLSYGLFGVLMAWTLVYAGRMRRRYAARLDRPAA